MNTQAQFWIEARRAIGRGLLTEREAHVIARTGTRKAGYWQRHLEDLRAVILERERR